MPQLDPTWYAAQLFWLAIILTFMHVVLKQFLLPRLMKVVDEREHTKVSALSLAEELKREAAEAELHYTHALADAKARSQQMFADAEVRMQQLEKAMQQTLESTISERVAASHAQLQKQSVELRAHMQEVVPSLVSDMVVRLTGVAPGSSQLSAAVKG